MKLDETGDYILCEVEGCPNKIKNHAWGQIKADSWFFSKVKDEAYCPDHVPKWVAKWRAVAASKKEKR